VTDFNPSWAWTAGSVISTLHDLKIWTRALATGQLLSAATQRERLSWIPFKGASWVGHDTASYGLGVADFGGVIGHNGQIAGFQSFLGYQPQKAATIVVLTNLYAALDGSKPADDLEKVIQKELFA
jgi:D-alanyl-D-alanine carboxypeptidase